MATRMCQKRTYFASEFAVIVGRNITKVATALLIFCLLLAVKQDRLLVAGQWDCPVTSSQYCSCQLDDISAAYIIDCRKNQTGTSFFATIGDVMVFSPQTTTTTIFESLSFDAKTIQIGQIGPSAFNGLRVRKLNLVGVGVRSIDPQAFVGIGPELVELVLDSNTLTSLPVNTLNQFQASSLQTISLIDNQLTELRFGTFSASLSSVRWLYLSENKLTTIADSLFVNLTSLLGLWLNGNLLTSISDSTFLGLTQLVWIDLSGNQIVSISSQAFSNQPLLERVTLEDNQLEALAAGLLAPIVTGNATRNGLVELVDFSGNHLTTLPAIDVISMVSSHTNDSSYFYVGLAGNSWNCTCNLVGLIRQLSSVSVGVDKAYCRTPLQAVNESVGCFAPNRCIFSRPIPDYCTSLTSSTSSARPPQSSSTVTISAVGASSSSGVNIGIIVGVIVGILFVVAAAVVIGVFCYFRRRQQREKKVSDFNNFNDGGSDQNVGEDGSNSTLKLMYRLGEARRYANQPLFDSNVKTIQATAAAKTGAANGGGVAEASSGDDRGPQEGGEEDVSVAAKAGLKTVMNTNVVAQNFGKVVSEC